ncbi:hypothetical protein FDECE_7721 [Fusarium decemcellulare]|nr:hypothetical protein FDECE_7721 [Fusarium decemcellulare]
MSVDSMKATRGSVESRDFVQDVDTRSPRPQHQTQHQYEPRRTIPFIQDTNAPVTTRLQRYPDAPRPAPSIPPSLPTSTGPAAGPRDPRDARSLGDFAGIGAHLGTGQQ